MLQKGSQRAFTACDGQEVEIPFPPGTAELCPFLIPMSGDSPKAFEALQCLLI